MTDVFVEQSKVQAGPVPGAEGTAQKRRDAASGEDERIRAWLNRFDGTIANMERIDYVTTVLMETRIISA